MCSASAEKGKGTATASRHTRIVRRIIDENLLFGEGSLHRDRQHALTRNDLVHFDRPFPAVDCHSSLALPGFWRWSRTLMAEAGTLGISLSSTSMVGVD